LISTRPQLPSSDTKVIWRFFVLGAKGGGGAAMKDTHQQQVVVAYGTIFSPSDHPAFNYFGIPSASFRQEVAPQTLFQQR